MSCGQARTGPASQPALTLSKSDSNKALADRFSAYFCKKIQNIWDALEDNCTDTCNHPSDRYSGTIMEIFEPATEEEIRKMITSYSPKSCSLDPIPTWLVKRCLDVLGGTITSLVNTFTHLSHTLGVLFKSLASLVPHLPSVTIRWG